jgi:uncharacterized membrane protein YsdA (DUF1294 family)
MQVTLLLVGYVIIVNLIGFLLMGIDKRKAVKHAFRIPESTLFIVALIGGSLGSLLGMYTFHHKTRHWYFVYGMPAILVLQIILVIAIFSAPITISIL